MSQGVKPHLFTIAVAGDGKKSDILGGPAEGRSSGGASG